MAPQPSAGGLPLALNLADSEQLARSRHRDGKARRWPGAAGAAAPACRGSRHSRTSDHWSVRPVPATTGPVTHDVTW
jgi:hypothetical protein